MHNQKIISEAKSHFKKYLAGKRLRMTPQRELILDIFLSTHEHISAEELYNLVKKEDNTVGQATVYRMLKVLSESGIARAVNFSDGVTRFETKFGHDHHDHIICEICNKNIEFVDEEIEELQNTLAEKHGYKLTGHSMYLYGICSSCQKKRS